MAGFETGAWVGEDGIDERKKAWLKRAADALKQAAHAVDSAVKASWERLAEWYKAQAEKRSRPHKR